MGRNVWVVSVDDYPKYVTNTKENAFNWLEDYLDREEKEKRNKILTEIKNWDFICNDNCNYAIDEVWYDEGE